MAESMIGAGRYRIRLELLVIPQSKGLLKKMSGTLELG